MRASILFLPLLGVLGACAPTLNQCLRNATHEVRILDKLIAETEATLARGYGYTSEEVLRYRWRRCDDYKRVPGVPVPRCFEPELETVKKPAAIDPLAEDRKLKALKKRRAALVGPSMVQVNACREAFPEG
ncbi:MAG: hypothetical protein WBC68_02215 [Albidovulum sp.]